MIKKILNKLFGSKNSENKLEEFDPRNPIHGTLLGDLIDTNSDIVHGSSGFIIVAIPELYTLASGYLLDKNISLEYSQMTTFIAERQKRSIELREFLNTCEYFSPKASGENCRAYGSENVLKKLPKRDSKGRFSK